MTHCSYSRVDFLENPLYGSGNDTGSWIGMVADVKNQIADMAVADLTINAERSTVVDFTYPFWFEPTGIAAKVERPDL